MHGGDIIAEALKAQGVKFLFTLCGGHISPILVATKQRGIRVIDTRHEVTTVFAADAVARLTGVPGVAAVTAGPGVTNTITAVKNAQLAQSPVILLGGATATALKGRGALQDIDQMALFKPHVKWAKSVKRVRDLAPALESAFKIARSDVPGPVFVECPVDLLYDESIVREWYGLKSPGGKSFADRAIKIYLNRHVNRLFAGAENVKMNRPTLPSLPLPDESKIALTAKKLQQAKKPVMLVGSQAVLHVREVKKIAEAVSRIGMPVFLSGMARGLLGKGHALQMRHKRRQALKEADLAILAGVPCDFRLDYGQHIRRSSFFISANRSKIDLYKNRRPDLALPGDAGVFLCQLADKLSGSDHHWQEWLVHLRQRDEAREQEIQQQAQEKSDLLNPVYLCGEIEKSLPDNAILVADGGDFVATASYIIRPRGPLTWLDPGVFGTLGVGAGFALGAKLCFPESQVWIIYGDGSVGYSLAEFDTFVRHGIPVIAVVGNDASWMQIAREQVVMLKDDVGTVLRHADYHLVAEGFGGEGFLVKDSTCMQSTLHKAKQAESVGRPVLINAHLGKTDFRKGSISM
jgi:acetolactate synthase-1/2/3 large subunit